MKGFIFLFLLGIGGALVGQVTDDFTDGDFTSNPTWSGDDSEFTIDGSNQLRLNNSSPASNNESYLSLPSIVISDATWEFTVGFVGLTSTGLSSSNQMFIFLVSDIADLEGSVNGYYVRVGGTDDDISLFSTNSGTPLIDGTDDVTQVSNTVISVRVTRDNSGNWELLIDNTGGSTYTSQGTATDITYTTSEYFGVMCDYTSTRATNFFFDDFNVTGTGPNDTTPPTIQSVVVISETEVDVQFDENVDVTTAENAVNYTIDGSVSVASASLDGGENSLVHLSTSALENGTTYTITINNVEDENGNVIDTDSQEMFDYLVLEEAIEFDVVINEFLASPSASSTIPNAEFVELFNRSSKFISLEDWTLSDQAGSSSTFSADTLEPGEFIILTKSGDGSLFETFGDVLEVGSFPSLNNAGDSIIISNASTTVIHETAYTSSSSGISSELINPNGPDYSENNYGLSTDANGGTPGEQNSIFDDTPDTTPPAISSISVISSTELDVSFDELLEETSAETTANYSIDGGITVSTATRDASDNQLVHLTVSALPSGETHTLTVNGVEDLSGNGVVDGTIEFEYIETEVAVEGDVVINEFLASPSATSTIPNAEYVELYNRSTKFIDLSGWTVSDAAGSSSPFGSYILRPDSFLILTETDNGALFSSYGDVLEINNFPSLNNAGDSIIISNASTTIIHETAYTSSSSGISSELINPNGPDYSENNYGLSTDADGGTPGKQNSIFDDTPDTTPPAISSISVISSTELDVSFDELLEETSAETTANYSIDGGITVSTATRDASDNQLVHLTVSALPSGETRTLTVNGVEDLSGNGVVDGTIEFEYIETEVAVEGDVVINEFLASPSATSTIPNAEYVELYNRSTKFIDLSGWTVSDAAGSSSPFGSYILRPDSFLILTETDNGALFSSYGDILEINNFPSLNNAGDSIIISNASTTVIHETAYTSSSSGISSELINPNGPDYSENNYGLSTDADGGTPGEQNSIFDDTPDTTPPAISSISVISSTELDVSFDELLEETSAETTANYSIDGGITVSTATRDASDNQLVHLTVSALPSGETHTLTVNGVEDLSGNGVVDGTIEFEYIETEVAVEGDVVINEFLASPSATSTIPNAEYVELYNRSTKFIDLSGWTVSDAAGSSSPFGSYILRPDSFLILTETDNGALFSSYGDVLEINNFPSLNNAGDSIIISNASTTIIHETAYTSSSSGISSELINPNGPDYSENNYGLSTDADGGTPGKQNSIFDDTPDTTPPAISSISVISSTELDVSFDELLEETSAETTANYSIDGGITVSTATRDASDNQLVHLTVSALPSGETRTLTVNGVEDLSGNGVVDGTIDFEYIETEVAVAGDVVINEFLADPIPSIGLPEAEFVELYNRSDKNISLLNWTLDGSTLMNYVLPPSQYVLVVDDSELEQFGGFDNVIGTSSLSLSNDEDRITLSDSSGQEIHAIFYEGSTSGVSMELINPNDPCLSEDSYVASVDSSGGTPGSQNAVFDDSPDVGAPQIQSYSFNTNLSITFSEVMDSLSLVNGTYNVDNGLSIGEIMPSGEFPKSVSISFSNEPAAGVIYELTISGISDCAGNVVEETTILFGSGRSPAFNEVIITEIMFDPEPQKSLPVREFIEIYNTTEAILSTENVFLADASDSVELPFTILNPGEFYVLTSTVAASEFEGNVIVISGFPSLNNSGEQLLLTNSGNLIFSLKYDPDWHDLDKVEGGYTLEMKDLNNPCLEENNWGSSQNSNGGTPGMPNSISESFPDNFSPEIIEVIAFDSDSVRIIFNEKIHPISENIGVFEISSIGVADTYFDPFFPNRLTLALEELLIENTIYTLVVSGIQDCSGNSSPETAVEFTRPIRAEAEEIKLSEILFNPRSNGNDFVEIFNDSDNYISLKDWQLATLDEGEVSTPKLITDEELIINPGQYLAFTTNSDELLANYPKGESENFIEVISMPSYANSEGAVLLLNENAEVVESFNYNEDFHYGLLESADGVSLERVSFESPNTADNWRSASSTEGFATPGYANSQSLAGKAPKGKVKANPEVFIPGNAGSGRDFTTINYELENPGQFANVNIYDQNGRLIKNLAQGVLLSTSGFLRWDGDTDDGQIARMGYYLIIFEIYDNSGNSEIVKESVVVGRDF